jgi:hypothetical protein
MGIMGSYSSNWSNGNLLSRWEEWEVTVQMGIMGSYSPYGRNRKLLSKWE